MKFVYYVSFGCVFITLILLVTQWVIPHFQLDNQVSLQSTTSTIDLDDLEASLLDRVRTVGPVQAREELKLIVRNENISERHGAGHVYGRVLYEEFDSAGLPYCDQDFSFGCYHEFFGHIISRDGVAVTTLLNEECFTAHTRLADAFGCQHGIGHGLQAYGGYTLEALRDALALCHTLSPLDSINGCYGGVVMEYNMKTMQFAHNTPPRERVADESLYYPCDSVPEYATEACYYWQSQWWIFALGLSADMVGDLCAEVASDRDRQACYFGVGNRIPDMVDGAAQAISICAAFTAVAPHRDPYIHCLASAAVTYAESGEVEIGNNICAHLDGSERAYCARIVRNE